MNIVWYMIPATVRRRIYHTQLSGCMILILHATYKYGMRARSVLVEWDGTDFVDIPWPCGWN